MVLPNFRIITIYFVEKKQTMTFYIQYNLHNFFFSGNEKNTKLIAEDFLAPLMLGYI